VHYLGEAHASDEGISMTAERVERRRVPVLVTDAESCLHGGFAASLKWANIWVVAATLLVVSVGGTAAQPKFAVQPETAAQSKSGESAARPKQILFLHSFGPNFQPWATWSKEIAHELNRQSPWPLDIQEQSLITARIGDDPAEAKFAEYLGILYVQRPPDLIVVLGAPAARFVQRHRAGLFPTTPTLLAAIEMRLVDQSMLSEQDAVVAVRVDQVALVENILRLLPETKAIAIIAGNSPNERFWAGEQKQLLGPLLANRVKLIFYDEWSFEAVLREVASLPPQSVIFFQQLVVDGTGAVYGDKEPLKRIYEVANAPIFSFDETYFTGETVGGPMWSPTEGARTTAAVAVRILQGERASGIKVAPIEFSTPKYDWRLLQRWNISPSRLPAGSSVYFREPTVWEQYRWQIALIAAIVLMQAGLISILAGEHRRRQVAEVQARQRMAELAHVSRFATAGEWTASIAHEINQPLGAILTNAETAQEILRSPSPDIAELTEIVGDILNDDRRANEVIRRMRSLLKKAPFELKALDLNDVARETVEFLSALAVGRKVELASVLTPSALPILGDRVQLQQVILNLVVNGIDAMRDAPNENRIITVRTSRIDDFAQLSVSDCGSGIPEDKLKEVFQPFFTSKPEGMGMGLSIARTIVEAHNGLISAKNRDHGGATFRIRLPIDA
jgi:signal transduction histidine kinase